MMHSLSLKSAPLMRPMSSGPSVARLEASLVAVVSPMHSIEVMTKTMIIGRITGAADGWKKCEKLLLLHVEVGKL